MSESNGSQGIVKINSDAINLRFSFSNMSFVFWLTSKHILPEIEFKAGRIFQESKSLSVFSIICVGVLMNAHKVFYKDNSIYLIQITTDCTVINLREFFFIFHYTFYDKYLKTFRNYNLRYLYIIFIYIII